MRHTLTRWRCENQHCRNVAMADQVFCAECYAVMPAHQRPTIEPKRMYEIKCLLCASVKYEQWKVSYARLRMAASAERCEHCGKSAIIEEADFGATGPMSGGRIKF